MQKLLKGLSMVMVLALVASIALTGCTKDAAQTPPSVGESTAPVEEAAPEPAIDTSEEVHLYGYLLGAELPGMPEIMDELNAKLKADINATMEINYIGWADLSAKYPLILAAGENVDWIYTAGWCQMPSQSAAGAFMEMTPEIYAQYMPLHWEKIKDTPALKECSIEGKDYMIPTATPDKKADVVIYRKDLADQYNIPEITKFSDIEPFLAAVKENNPDMIPLNMDGTYDLSTALWDLYKEKYDMMVDICMVTGTGSGLYYNCFDPAGKLHLMSSDPDVLPGLTEAGETVKTWYDAGYVNHDAFANQVRSKESLVAGGSAVAFGNSIDIQGNLQSCAEAGMDIGIIPILGGQSGKTPANAYTNNGVAISSKSKNWKRTLMAMDFIMEEESYVDLVYYGIEGRDYTINADGALDYTGLDTSLYPVDSAGFWFVNKDLFKPASNWTPGYAALQEQIPGMLATDFLAAFSPNTESFKTQLANCNQVLIQYMNPIYLGAVEDVAAAFQTLDEQLNAAGVEDIQTEMQSQIDTYLAQ